MKNIFKTFGISLLVIMLLSVTYTVKALEKNYFEVETEATLEIENWMMDEAIWGLQEDVKKGTPMLAITPEGDTVKIYIEDVIKVKDTTVVNQYNTYNTYNSYKNYDGWVFYYNDSWIMSSIWYHNYYHMYYPIVHRHIYHTPNQIKNYYKRHNVVIINPRVINKRYQTYERVERFNPNRSRFNNNNYYRHRNDSRFNSPQRNIIQNKQRRTTGQQQIQRNQRPQQKTINRSGSNQRQGRR